MLHTLHEWRYHEKHFNLPESISSVIFHFSLTFGLQEDIRTCFSSNPSPSRLCLNYKMIFTYTYCQVKWITSIPVIHFAFLKNLLNNQIVTIIESTCLHLEMASGCLKLYSSQQTSFCHLYLYQAKIGLLSKYEVLTARQKLCSLKKTSLVGGGLGNSWSCMQTYRHPPKKSHRKTLTYVTAYPSHGMSMISDRSIMNKLM